jgi:sugar phosphate isomerase/epimerase
VRTLTYSPHPVTAAVKLSYWTLEMPFFSAAEFAAKAVEFGYQGVDLRCTRPDERGRPAGDGVLSIASADAEIDEIRSAFEAVGVEIPTLLCYRPRQSGGSSHTNQSADWGWLEEDVAAHARLAERVGASRIRIAVGAPGAESNWKTHLENLWLATQRGVASTPRIGVLFENHPGSANAEQLLLMAEEVGDPRLCVLFSPDHTLVMQEDTLGLARRYAAQIGQVCFSDRRVVEEDLACFDGQYYHVRYEVCWPGEGRVPARALLQTLAQQGFDGYVALKWEHSRHPESALPSGEVALPHFVNFIRGLRPIDS